MGMIGKFSVVSLMFFNLSVTVYTKKSSNLFVEENINTFFKTNASYYEYYKNKANQTGDSISVHNDLKCFNQVNLMLDEMSLGSEMWARLMFDAWGKLQSGILSGNLFNWGHFEQCLRIQADTQYGDLRGQHCVLQYQRMGIQMTVPPQIGQQPMIAGIIIHGMHLATGVCLPQSCSPQFVYFLMNNFLNQNGFEVTNNDLTPWCHTNDWPAFRVQDIVAIALFSTIAGIMVASTIYDVITRNFQIQQIQLLLAFSMYTNGKKLFAMKRRKPSSNTIDCIHGIRTISLIWIILGHRYVVYTYTPVINFVDIFDWIKAPHSVFITAAPFAVDTFLFISGLLVTWSVFGELEKSRRIHIFLMYIHRYLRLTPALAAMIFMHVTLFKHFGSGPFYTFFVQQLTGNCERYWWSTLSYVQNYVNPLSQCLAQAWYLAVDFQLFLLSPFILYPLWRWKIKILWIIPVLIILSMACIFGNVYLRDLRVWSLNESIFMAIERMITIYYPTHTRYGAYFIGVVTAYFLFQYKNRPVIIPKLINVGLWMASLGILVTMIFTMLPQQQVHNNQTKIGAAFYETFSRVGWAIGLAWIIFSCANGLGGPIDWFLGHPAFQPFARMSYSIFITHLPIQMLLVAAQRQPGYLQDFHLAHLFWGDLGFTLTVSVFWSLAFEFPIPVLEKYLFGFCFGIGLEEQSAGKPKHNDQRAGHAVA